MERVVYEQMAALDQRHWWYRARRHVLAALIRRAVHPPEGARILELGCGTGHNLEMLQRFGRVEALELDEAARTIAEQRLGGPVMRSPLPDLADVPTRTYDLICAFDVIEHIADDEAAIASIAERLKPGGTFLMTVPAHTWMWTAHDADSHHQRRYSMTAAKALIAGSPLRLERIGYFNSLLFPLAFAARMTSKLRGKKSAKFGIPPAPVNAALEAAFATERHLIGRVPLPPGLSLFVLAKAQG